MTHAVAPAREYCPAPHTLVHCALEPVDVPYRPALHSVQLPVALDVANWPAGHWVHPVLPPGAYCPGLHVFVQLDAPLLVL